MSNVTVQEALKSVDIEKLLCDADLPLPSPYGAAYFHEYLARYKKFAESYHAALAEIEKCEPVGWYCKACKETGLSHCSDPENCGGMVRTYTSPISKEWVGLSDEQQTEIINDYISWQGGCNPQRIARLIEAKLKQLNAEKG